MTVKEALEVIDDSWTRLENARYSDEEVNKALWIAEKSLEAWENVVKEITSKKDDIMSGIYQTENHEEKMRIKSECEGLILASLIIEKHLSEVEE